MITCRNKPPSHDLKTLKYLAEMYLAYARLIWGVRRMERREKRQGLSGV